MNIQIVIYVLGIVLNIEAISMILPLICAIIYGEYQSASIFLLTIALCAILGVGITAKKPANKSIYSKEGYVIAALAWIVMSVFGALPFWFSGSMPHYIDALFETVSGFTTTGSTILTDVESLSKSMLFWRSFLHFMGGVGVLVFLVAILPLSGGENFNIVKAESTGPAVSKLVPKVKSTAKILYAIYISITALEAISLLIGGMSLYDSLTIAFATAGTGGFATTNAGMGAYAPHIQVIITVFMILFGIDFTLYYLIIIGRIKDVLSSDDLKTYLGVILTAGIIIAFNIRGYFPTIAEALRHSFFQVGAIITTTGFTTYDFDKWPELSKTILVTLMFVGACAGSTGGGMKVTRIIILFKSIVKEIKFTAHPRRTYKLVVSGRPVAHETVRAVNVYTAAFMLMFVISLLIISMDNYDFTTNFTTVATMINNIGPGLNKVGPVCNFSFFSVRAKIVMIFDMLLGRLELFPILLLFSRHTWKK